MPPKSADLAPNSGLLATLRPFFDYGWGRLAHIAGAIPQGQATVHRVFGAGATSGRAAARDMEVGGNMDSSVDVVIIGMGYVGLPLAREASAAGLSVIGLDISPEVVDGLNHGRSHVDDLADYDVAEMVRHGFFATADTGQLRRARTIVICVPTPLSKDGAPDLDLLRRAVRSVA
jgi:hypothetical protein